MGDAMAELAGALGYRAHRSWWIAAEAVELNGEYARAHGVALRLEDDSAGAQVEEMASFLARTAGLGGEMFRRAGASVVTLPAGQIFQALQSGTIDAAEFVGPMSDAPLGLHQVTRNYYHPGVQEPSSAEEIGVNMARWNALPNDLKQSVAFACRSIAEEITTEYDAGHPRALAELVSRHGVTPKAVPRDVLIALGNSAGDILAEFRNTRTRW